MANQEQLDILEQGVEAWNKWREENRRVEIDLCNADLLSANLTNANLIGANLTTVNLSYAYLNEALQLHLFGESLPEGAFGEELFSL
jgi:uncharacterized protein YjbI with pentapeptide repeats